MLKHLVMFKISVVKMVWLYTDNKPPPYTVGVCHRQYVSVTHSLFLSHTVYVCHRQSMSVTDSCRLSQEIFVRQRKNMSVTDIMCMSQTVCVFPWQSLFVTVPLCFSERVCVCHKMVFCLLVCDFIKHSYWSLLGWFFLFF